MDTTSERRATRARRPPRPWFLPPISPTPAPCRADEPAGDAPRRGNEAAASSSGGGSSHEPSAAQQRAEARQAALEAAEREALEMLDESSARARAGAPSWGGPSHALQVPRRPPPFRGSGRAAEGANPHLCLPAPPRIVGAGNQAGRRKSPHEALALLPFCRRVSSGSSAPGWMTCFRVRRRTGDSRRFSLASRAPTRACSLDAECRSVHSHEHSIQP